MTVTGSNITGMPDMFVSIATDCIDSLFSSLNVCYIIFTGKDNQGGKEPKTKKAFNFW